MTKEEDKAEAKDKAEAEIPFPFLTVEETIKMWKLEHASFYRYHKILYPKSKLVDDKKDEEKDSND